MGQTLTHGVYLPDEGERNSYDGLASNWAILDGAVGTVAEHTSQIAGKAPLVHTHTKSDITDFPAYGTTAGTICEGNDSRLSDARTPVAHTHTKSNVTDLFNSANTWTENNTFSNFITSKESAAISAGSYGKGIAFRDYQNNRLGYIQPYLTSNSEKRVVIGADSGDVASNSNLIPNTNNANNLGSSSYRWKTLNGINPGALSFPDGTTDNSDTTFNPDTTTWAQNGTSFTITAQVTGWLHIRIKNVTGNFVWVKRASSGSNQTWGLVGDSNSNSDISDIGLNVPVIKDKTYTLKLKTASFYAVIFLCLGNV